jgi:hypothetical protein
MTTNPITEQMDAATARVNDLLAGMRRDGVHTFVMGADATPPGIHDAALAVGTWLESRDPEQTIRHCPHAESIQPMFLFAMYGWNLAFCETCATERGRELADMADKAKYPWVDCNLCGSVHGWPATEPWAFGLGFYLVRGWGCEFCLAERPAPGPPTRTPQHN